MKEKIGIIGYGNMGSAIAERLKEDYEIIIFDEDMAKVKKASDLSIVDSSIDLVKQSEIIILAVKPQDFNRVLESIKECASAKLVISIAAGITTKYIENILTKSRITRVMPNLGVKIGMSETSLCQGRSASEDDLSKTKELFDLLGKTWIMDERMIDAATAICGSGPGYIFYDMEKNNIKADLAGVSEATVLMYIRSLTIAAQTVGFDKASAADFAAATIGTSIELVAQTGLAPAELRRQVTSKGGTTEAGIKVLSENGSWSEAALAALQRAKELSK